MTSMSFSERQHISNITLTSTKLTKLTTILLITYYFQLLSYWVAVQMLIVITGSTKINLLYFPDSIVIASLEGLTVCLPVTNECSI